MYKKLTVKVDDKGWNNWVLECEYEDGKKQIVAESHNKFALMDVLFSEWARREIKEALILAHDGTVVHQLKRD